MDKIQMEDFISKYKLIKDSQHGFRNEKSCLTDLLSFLEFVTKGLDKGGDIDVIYFRY